jgi:hypothetical protein
LDVTAEFADPWQYRVSSDGFGGGTVVDDENAELGSPGRFADLTSNVAVVSIPKAALGGADIADWEVCPVVGSADYGAFRAVRVDAGGYVFGGAREDAAGNAPRVIDLVTPDGTDQSAALDYGPDSLATLPFTPL